MTQYIITATRVCSMGEPEVSIIDILDDKNKALSLFTSLVDDAMEDYGEELDNEMDITIDTEAGIARVYNSEDPLMDYYEIKIHTHQTADSTISPVMKQFMDLKSKHPDSLILFRSGDFYETYQQDAEKASDILGIILTNTKMKDPDGNSVKMAGFPCHALDTYLPKFIRAGERVAICDTTK